MQKMGIFAVYPRPRTTQSNPQHKVYPYLLRDVEINRPNQVWSTDITYVPIHSGYVYLAAVIDNVFVERLWRSVKYEEIYIKEYADVTDLINSIGRYFDFYNHSRPHQGLGGQTPAMAWNHGI